MKECKTQENIIRIRQRIQSSKIDMIKKIKIPDKGCGSYK